MIALVRIIIGGIFLLFGEYKLASPAFATEGFSKYLAGYIESEAVRWYAPLLQNFIQPHPTFFGYSVGAIELLIAVSLILGWYVRPVSILGALYMLNLTLCTWWAPGHQAPIWQYFGAELDHLPLLLMFLIFFASNAGKTWGMDRR